MHNRRISVSCTEYSVGVFRTSRQIGRSAVPKRRPAAAIRADRWPPTRPAWGRGATSRTRYADRTAFQRREHPGVDEHNSYLYRTSVENISLWVLYSFVTLSPHVNFRLLEKELLAFISITSSLMREYGCAYSNI